MEWVNGWGNIAEKNIVSMQAVYSDGQFTWISNFEYNSLIKVEEISNSIVKVEPFVQEDIDEFALHKGVVRYNNKIIFYPNRGSGLNIINLENGEQEYCPLTGHTIEEKRCKFSSAILQGEKLWLIPQDYQQILLSVNLENYQVEECTWWKAMLEQNDILNEVAFMGADILENDVLISVRKQNYFLRCSLDEEKAEKIVVQGENIQLHRVFGIGDAIWCTSYNSEELYVVSQNGEIVKKIVVNDNKKGIVPYMTLVACPNGVAVIPRYKNEVVIYGYSGERITEIYLQYHRKITNKNTVIYNFATKQKETKLILYPNYDGVVREVDLADWSVKENEYKAVSLFHEYYVKNILPICAKKEMTDRGYIVERKKDFSLNEYLRYLVEHKNAKMQDEKKKDSDIKQESSAEKIVKVIKTYYKV